MKNLMKKLNKLKVAPYNVAFKPTRQDETRAAGDDFDNKDELIHEDIPESAEPKVETVSGNEQVDAVNTSTEEPKVETVSGNEQVDTVNTSTEEPKETVSCNEQVDAVNTSMVSESTIEHQAEASNNAQPIEADMAGNRYIKDQNEDGVINFGMFGISIDTKINGKEEIPKIIQTPQNNQQQNPYLDHLDSQKSMPIIQNDVQANPVQPHSPIMNLYNTNNQSSIVGKGRHMVDNPKQTPKVEKAKEDDIEVDLKNIDNMVDVEQSQPNKWPDVVSSPLVQAEKIEQQLMFDNTPVVKEFQYMGEIEKIASKYGVQLNMIKRFGIDGKFTGLINCIAYTETSAKTYIKNQFKSFTIDTGRIIDHRSKFYPVVIDVGYEDQIPYLVHIPKPTDKSKNVINTELFDKFFQGGGLALDIKDAMYTQEYIELNKYVALITMPTNKTDKESRKAVRNRLLAAMKAGVFSSVIEKDRYSRFRFVPKLFNKDSLEFTLTNQDVPYNFCGPVLNTKHIEIEFKQNGETSVNYF